MTKEERLKKIKETIVGIEKELGKGIVKNMSEDHYEIIPTGCLSLDIATGIGGMPLGRIVELVGEESTSKSTIALHVISEAQKAGYVCSYIDTEHAFDSEYAQNLGVNVDELQFAQPDYAEQGFELACKLAESGYINVIVFDSIAAAIPKAELDGTMEDSKMGLHARIIGRALRKLTGICSKNKVLLILINQYRVNIGVMYGDNRVPTGGNSLKFFASMRIQTSKSLIKEGDEVIANTVKAKFIKNKCAPPFKTAEFEVEFGEGIDKIKDIIKIASDLKIISKGGAGWFTYKDIKIQGADKLKQILKDNPELFEEIKEQVLKTIYV